jgi:hypothetical protein
MNRQVPAAVVVFTAAMAKGLEWPKLQTADTLMGKLS